MRDPGKFTFLTFARGDGVLPTLANSFFCHLPGVDPGCTTLANSLFCHLPGVDPGCMTMANSLFLPFARGDGVLPTLANPIFHCLPGYNRVFSPLANVLFPIYQGIHHTLSQSCLFNKIGSSRRFLFAPIEKARSVGISTERAYTFGPHWSRTSDLHDVNVAL